jgi:putative inorganic carbon (hco3(-)) transporter
LLLFLHHFLFELEDFDINVGVSLPAEPIMFVILLLFVIKIFFDGKLFDKPVLKHPITLAVIFYLLWMLITSVTSEVPIVSFKYITARLWFVASFFFFGILLFKNIKNIKAFIWLFTISLAGVILFNSVNHAAYGFERQVGTWIVHPFFNDHTQYACVIALITPFIVAFIFNKQFSRTNQRFMQLFYS